MDIKSELQMQGVRLAAGLASSDDLRCAADTALNMGMYSPSLAEVALFSEYDLMELAQLIDVLLKNFKSITQELLLRQPGNGFASEPVPTTTARFMNRRVRNRTHGGVGGRRA